MWNGPHVKKPQMALINTAHPSVYTLHCAPSRVKTVPIMHLMANDNSEDFASLNASNTNAVLFLNY